MGVILAISNQKGVAGAGSNHTGAVAFNANA